MLVKGLNRFAPLIPSGIQYYTNLLQKSLIPLTNLSRISKCAGI